MKYIPWHPMIDFCDKIRNISRQWRLLELRSHLGHPLLGICHQLPPFLWTCSARKLRISHGKFTNANLVGGIPTRPTPLKNMKVSWDDDIPNIWKNKNHVPNHQAEMVIEDYFSWAATNMVFIGYDISWGWNADAGYRWITNNNRDIWWRKLYVQLYIYIYIWAD